MGNEPNQHGLGIIPDCRNCPLRTEGFFCQFAPPILDELSAIGQLSVYPKGAILFWKGQLAQAFFILCSGRVKLGISSTRGRSVVLKIAEGGDVLGLSALLLSQPHLVSAEALEPVQVKLLFRPDFVRFMRAHEEVSQRMAVYVSKDLHCSYQQVARIVLSPTPQSKLISLFLEWASREGQPPENNQRLRMHLTQEQIGQLCGISRETVSRLLTRFRKQGLVRIKGTSVTLQDIAKLKTLLD